MNERPPESESNTNSGQTPETGNPSETDHSRGMGGAPGTGAPPHAGDAVSMGVPPHAGDAGSKGVPPHADTMPGSGIPGNAPPPPGGVPPHAGNAGFGAQFHAGNPGQGAQFRAGNAGPGPYQTYGAGGYGRPAYAGGGYGYAYPPGAYRPTPRKRMKPWKKALIIIAIIVAVVIFFVSCISSMFQIEESAITLPTNDYLARFSVVGEIGNYHDPSLSSAESYHHGWTMNAIDRLIDDGNNRGLILYVDSPGGTVYESDEIYFKIMEYKQVTGRPVYVYMGSMAASGGYYIAAPADKIYANRNTWTGSIGVIIGTLFDVSEFLARYGVKATDITSGANKSMGSNFEPMTDEQRALFQGMVDEAYEQFVGIVAEGRGMSPEAVKQIADGRILTAKQAVDAALIDEIALEEDAIESIKAEMGDPDIEVSDIRFVGQPSLFGSLISAFPVLPGIEGLSSGARAGESALGVSSDIARVLELAQQGERVPIKYLYQG